MFHHVIMNSYSHNNIYPITFAVFYWFEASCSSHPYSRVRDRTRKWIQRGVHYGGPLNRCSYKRAAKFGGTEPKLHAGGSPAAGSPSLSTVRRSSQTGGTVRAWAESLDTHPLGQASTGVRAEHLWGQLPYHWWQSMPCQGRDRMRKMSTQALRLAKMSEPSSQEESIHTEKGYGCDERLGTYRRIDKKVFKNPSQRREGKN